MKGIAARLYMLHRYAASNTRRGVESCGILAGVLDEKNACFQICTLIIPKQEGTSDTVQVRSPTPHYFSLTLDPPCLRPLRTRTGMGLIKSTLQPPSCSLG